MSPSYLHPTTSPSAFYTLCVFITIVLSYRHISASPPMLSPPSSLDTYVHTMETPFPHSPVIIFTRIDSVTGGPVTYLEQKHFKAEGSPDRNISSHVIPGACSLDLHVSFFLCLSQFHSSIVCFSPRHPPSGEEAHPYPSNISCGGKRPYPRTVIGSQAWRSLPHCLSATQRCLGMIPSANRLPPSWAATATVGR